MSLPEDYSEIVLVLSGGGTKGIAELGALQYFWEQNILNHYAIRAYCGTSVGSAICLLLICGYTPIEIFTYIYERKNFFDTSTSNTGITSVITFWGLLSSKIISTQLEDMIRIKMNDPTSCIFGMKTIPTLSQLKERSGKDFSIVTTNINMMRAEYFDAENFPNISCLDAVRISCSIPLIFQRIKYKNQFYVDGGCADNFPVGYAYSKYPEYKMIGISVSGISKNDVNVGSFVTYLNRTLTFSMNALTLFGIDQVQNLDKETNRCGIFHIEIPDVDIINFKMNSKEKMRLYASGYDFVKRRYKENH